MNDLEYIDHGMFTSFIPVSKAGEVAFNQMAEDMLRELGIE